MKIATYLSSALFLLSCGNLHAANDEVKNQALSNTQNSKQYTNRIIIKMKPGSEEGISEKSSSSSGTRAVLSHVDIQSMADDSGESLSYVRAMRGTSAHVVEIDRMASIDEVNAIAAAIEMGSDSIEYAEPDSIVFPLATTPNDEFYNNRQWNLHSSSEQGLNLPNAWDHTTGSSEVVVAILDTGILPDHVDFDQDRLLPGFDMVSEDSAGQFLSANDGDGRDADPTDPGDWVIASEVTQFAAFGKGCDAEDSTWHGTHVAGIIGAATNDNGTGVAGVDWNAKILPVRVLGKCGGYISDVADGIYWAVGLAVAGLENNLNPSPADVINLSIGRTDTCSDTETNAINAARALGAVVVVAAGNESADVSTSAPANCANVIAVAAHDRSGGLASYSNKGSGVDILAPGGDDFINCDDSHGAIYSLGDSGLTNALNDDEFICMNGTSMAAPHISGLAALMLSKNSSLTPDQIESGLKESARAFVNGTSCSTSICGSGLADAEAAILATAQPIAPSNFTMAEVDFDLKFDWTDNSLLEKGFKVERDVNGGGFEELVTLEKDITTYTDEVVIDGAVLTYRIASINGIYLSSYSDEVNITLPLSKASNLAVEEGSDQVKLTWLDSSNSELGYQIDRSENNNSNYKRLGVVPEDTSFYTDSNLKDGAIYYYKVQTISEEGLNEAIEEIEAYTLISAPTGLIGRSSSGQIKISWVDNSESENGFIIERSIDNLNYTEISSVSSGVITYYDNNVSSSNLYYYRVKAFKEEINSESLYSEVVALSTSSSTKGAGTLHWYLMFALLILVGRVKSIKA